MVLGIYIKSFFGLLATALIGWALIPGLELLKLIAVAVGISLLLPIGYPHIRGVRKGDGLLAVKNDSAPMLLFSATTCVALSDGKKGQTIGVMFSDGALAQAVIVGYEGLITPARVRVTQEEKPRMVDGITVI